MTGAMSNGGSNLPGPQLRYGDLSVMAGESVADGVVSYFRGFERSIDIPP
jgi:hypothetical protein